MYFRLHITWLCIFIVKYSTQSTCLSHYAMCTSISSKFCKFFVNFANILYVYANINVCFAKIDFLCLLNELSCDSLAFSSNLKVVKISGFYHTWLLIAHVYIFEVKICAAFMEHFFFLIKNILLYSLYEFHDI